MKNQPIYNWDSETGEATCILTDGNNVFYGNAICHNKDSDMKNEKTGLEIAFRRAQIKALQHIKNNEIKPMLKAYKQLYYSMNTSKNFNKKSYENKMLQRKIREKQYDLDVINDMIATEQKDLKKYLEEKEKFYQKVRSNREKAKSN